MGAGKSVPVTWRLTKFIAALPLATKSAGFFGVAWCELRCDFRVFRLDRMRALTVTNRVFVQEAGKAFVGYMRSIERKFGP